MAVRPVGSFHLLDVEPEFGDGLPEETRRLAAALALPAFEVSGTFDLRRVEGWPGVQGRITGLLVLNHGVLVQVQVAGRWCARWLGSGQLLLAEGEQNDALPASWRWSANPPSTVLVLDDRLTAACRQWPSLWHAVLERAAWSARSALLQQACSQLPRVEDRILAFLWAVADRQGTVHADGVHVPLPLTHTQLGELVGSRRPTVSLGLRPLADEGLVREEHGIWWLSRESMNRFAGADPELENGTVS